MSDKVCPFCDEADFDMVGLKIHLNAGDCYAFNDTPGPARTVRLGDARASRPREAGSGAVEKQARLDANAAAYALCNGERGAVPSRFQFDIEQTLVPYFIEARARSATAQGDDLADRIFTQAKDPASPLSKALWGPPPVPPADEDAPKCEGCDSPATTMDGDGVDLCEPCAKAITPPVAPEACPVAEKPLAWTAFSESSSWTGVWCKTREGAQERVDEFKRRWPKTGPYRVVPLYAQPARATGRDVAVEKARQAFYEAARALAEVIDDHCCEPESRSAAKASATCGEREFAFKEAHNALLAAEAEERGEKEA